ncbi:MAG: malto-oligosyltrehalose synthase [Paludisphaera borealis]|uniref:malto-oligosyltrehalose synthase n=1 Tax=Paludisphaera borealis TaxID=1387353 RepID=UPI00283E8BA7|nr:malto-oligosyltrehalose synthase [Paludisphaera borealis]MDR3619894.1 malto-oligosyltrehalose synthase [Paludisphaera borealis]
METPAGAHASAAAPSTTLDESANREALVGYVKEFLAAALDEIGRRRVVPTATYRFQFHAGFKFRDAQAVVPYLAKLGITECYASPYLKAAPGSTHGYDITDHSQLNPEIGTEAEHAELLETLRAHGLGLILDVVPNHMGILGNENPWWNDVLENGQASIFAGRFDIDWAAPTRPENRGRVLLPFLGGLYGEVLEKGELRLGQDAGAFHIQYHEHRFPLDPHSYQAILEPAIEPITLALGVDDPGALEFQSILTASRNLPPHNETGPARIAERNREKEIVKRRLSALLNEQPAIAEAVSTVLETLNGAPGDPRSFDALDALLEAQPYRLAFWRVASDEINYRRFFDINALVALRADRYEVVRATHQFVLEIVARHGAIGLRIDHPDGLLDPLTYLQRLQETFVLLTARRRYEEGPSPESPPWAEVEPLLRELTAASAPGPGWPPWLYVVVEKILGFDESLPEDWPTHGTSGYDALNRINGLFVDTTNASRFTRQYHELIGDDTTYKDLVYAKKELIMEASLSSELHVLAYHLERIALRDRRARDFTHNALRTALREVIAAFPVYRSYITRTHVGERDRELVGRAVRTAIRRNPLISRSVFEFQRRVLLDRSETPEVLPENEPEQVDFAGKFQQVTAPVTAKGIEDTTFYIYNRLTSLNEVGGEPDRFGASPASLHKWNAWRARRFPYALSALSTHDTKRSEDVRARINVLSEIPEAWFDAFVRWSELNVRHRAQVDDAGVPEHNEEYLLYQTLLGAWPTDEMDAAEFDDFRDRIRAYMAKAIHEAKVHTSWQNPNEEYDAAVDQFIVAILDRSKNAAFFKDFLPFQRMISRHGRINGLAQTLLKLTMPGVPDTYQGTEIWDFSLVDPDNRRPVDYARRAEMLDELSRRHDAAGDDRAGLASELSTGPADGRAKLYVNWRALHARKRSPELFAIGEYRALAAVGRHEASLFAFHRSHGSESAIVAAPRLSTRLAFDGDLPVGPEVWGDSTLQLPGIEPGIRYQDAFTGAIVTSSVRDGTTVLAAGEVFAHFPVALLVET